MADTILGMLRADGISGVGLLFVVAVPLILLALVLVIYRKPSE